MTIRMWMVGAALLATCVAAAAEDGTRTAEANKAKVGFGSAAAYGGVTQNYAICLISNVGKSVVKLKNTRIYDQSGDPVAPYDLLPGLRCDHGAIKLPPGQTCLALSTITVEGAYSFSTSANSTTELRGTYLSYRSDFSTGASAPLE